MKTLKITFLDILANLINSLTVQELNLKVQKRAKYVRVGEVIPMVLGKLYYVKSISLNAEIGLIKFKLNTGISIIRDFDETVPTMGNIFDGTHDTKCH